jgi:hypothetical protein
MDIGCKKRGGKMSEKEMKAKEKFNQEWKWFCSRINWGATFLDARAITFMNEIGKHIEAIENGAGK